jgi:hypothetical protein
MIEMEINDDDSGEFGTGFLYCIGLFLMHDALHIGPRQSEVWFSGATDHLIDMTIPENLSPDIKSRIELWRDSCISKRLRYNNTQEDVNNAIDDALEFLMLFDKMNGINVKKAEYN